MVTQNSTELPEDVLQFISRVSLQQSCLGDWAAELLAEYNAPKEPTGLGVVVRDARQTIWVSVMPGRDSARWRSQPSATAWMTGRWSSLPRPVEILSAGVEL